MSRINFAAGRKLNSFPKTPTPRLTTTPTQRLPARPEYLTEGFPATAVDLQLTPDIEGTGKGENENIFHNGPKFYFLCVGTICHANPDHKVDPMFFSDHIDFQVRRRGKGDTSTGTG